jgi:hypothetical protein
VKHRATPKFWQFYAQLPQEIQRLAQTSFGFGLVITASMTESSLDAADNGSSSCLAARHFMHGAISMVK